MAEVCSADLVLTNSRGEARTSLGLMAGTAPAGGCAGTNTTVFWELTKGGCRWAKLRASTGW